MVVIETGKPKNITATGAVSTNQCQMLGFYVNSTGGGTLVLRDGGSGGTAVSGTITPAIGFHRFPCDFTNSGGAHATIAVAALDVTFFFAAAGGYAG